jgi:hypothetical protein
MIQYLCSGGIPPEQSGVTLLMSSYATLCEVYKSTSLFPITKKQKAPSRGFLFFRFYTCGIGESVRTGPVPVVDILFPYVTKHQATASIPLSRYQQQRPTIHPHCGPLLLVRGIFHYMDCMPFGYFCSFLQKYHKSLSIPHVTCSQQVTYPAPYVPKEKSP